MQRPNLRTWNWKARYSDFRPLKSKGEVSEHGIGKRSSDFRSLLGLLTEDTPRASSHDAATASSATEAVAVSVAVDGTVAVAVAVAVTVEGILE